MRTELIFHGFPGKLASGYMGWSAVVLIETAGKKILFDTGGPGKRNDIRKRLLNLSIKPGDIDILVLSHFHEDHVYNFDYFTNAKILLHEKEAEWVLSDPDDFPMPKFLYPVVEKTGRLELISKDVEIVPGVQTLHVPGHTPGCMALILRDEDMPTTVLAGDAVKNLAELAYGKVAMTWDDEASARSIRTVREIAKVVVPGHDRLLAVQADRIEAITSIHETIIVPPGVVDKDGPRYLELVIEPTWLAVK